MPQTNVQKSPETCQGSERSAAMQERSAAPVDPRPRNPDVEAAWTRYAVAFEARARLMDISSTILTLAQNYNAVELERLRVLEEKHRECNDYLLEYYEIYDADQREIFG